MMVKQLEFHGDRREAVPSCLMMFRACVGTIRAHPTAATTVVPVEHRDSEAVRPRGHEVTRPKHRPRPNRTETGQNMSRQSLLARNSMPARGRAIL